MKRAYKLVAKVNKSTKATEKLINKAGKKLISDCPTRWSSTYLMLQRLLLVKRELSSVLEELQWDNLPNSHWKQIENIIELLKPFAIYTQLASSEDTTSISMVVPVIMELRLHLEQMKSVHGLCLVAGSMLDDLDRRFGFMVNPADVSFDPLYIVSTYLSSAYKEVLSDEQTAAAKSNLLKQMSGPQLSNVPRNEPDASQEDNGGAEDQYLEEPPSKKFKHLMGLLKEKQKAKGASSSSSRSAEDIEIENYANSFQTYTDEDEDPFVFWQNNSSMYPLISCFAFDLLSTRLHCSGGTNFFNWRGCNNGKA